MNKVKLYCLPYAGSTSMLYSKWRKKLHTDIELRPIELPGRGRRFSEGCLTEIGDVVECVINEIEDTVNSSAYALFGHSMGSLIVYETVQQLMERGFKKPVHVFFSGRSAPHIREGDEIVSGLPEDEFIKVILKYGGIPDEVLANKEMKDVFLPILRADYKIIESFDYSIRERKLDFDVTVLNGRDDGTLVGDMSEWGKHVCGKCDLKYFDGGHFFINERMEEVVSLISKKLGIN